MAHRRVSFALVTAALALACAAWLWVAPLPAFAQPATVRVVELNTATQAELEQVPGIGPQLAERLLAARADGHFADWPDAARRVKGLGPATQRKLAAGGLRVAGASLPGYPPAAAAAASSPQP